jgi:RsiW-degrading membrane proteinase PrsW (M82 family)
MVAFGGLIYLGVVLSGVRAFWISFIAYLPAAVGMLVVYARRRRQAGPWWWGIIGVLLTFVAAGVQVGQVALHPRWFNHNALYHLIQVIALFAIARAAGGRTTESPHATG